MKEKYNQMSTPKTQSIDSFLQEHGFLLHHSPDSGIEIGSTIRTSSLSAHQVTAGDALAGYSYAWDAQTGVRDSVVNQVSKRGSYGDSLTGETIGVKPGARAHTVYLTRANQSSIFPDVNVPGSPARAIKGELAQTVLDKIIIPANLSDQEAIDLVQQMVDRAGVPRLSEHEMIAKDYAYAISDRGTVALNDFEEIQGQRYLHLKEETIQRHLDRVISGETTMDQLGVFREEVEALSVSREAFQKMHLNESAQILGKETGTAGDIVRSGKFFSMAGRAEKLQAVISSVKGTSAENLVGKELGQMSLKQVEKGLIESMTIRRSTFPKPIGKSVGKSSAGKSFFDHAVTSASGSKIIKAFNKAIKSAF